MDLLKFKCTQILSPMDVFTNPRTNNNRLAPSWL